MSPMPGFSTDGILLRCILPNIAWLGFSLLMHMARKNHGGRHSRRPKRGALQRRCRSGGPRLLRTLFASSSAGDASGCAPPSHPAGRLGRLGWAGCGVFAGAPGCGGRSRTHNPQPVFQCVMGMKSRKQAQQQQQANIPQQAEEPLLGVAISPPLQAFGSPSPVSSRVRRRTGETPPHTPPHRRHVKPAVMVRSSEGDFEKGAV